MTPVCFSQIITGRGFTTANKRIQERQEEGKEILGKDKSLYMSQVAHQAGAYPGFCSMKRLGVFLLPPGWDASPVAELSPALSSLVLIYTPG